MCVPTLLPIIANYYQLLSIIIKYYHLLKIFTKIVDLRDFVAKYYCRDIGTFSAVFLKTENQTPQIFALLECMDTGFLGR